MISANQSFVQNPFSGNAYQLQKFQMEIKSEVSRVCNKYGLDYLRLDWQKDADGMPQVGNVEGHEYDSTYNYPDRPICYDEFPQTIMPNGNYPNPTQVKARRENIRVIDAKRAKLDNLYSQIETILKARLSSSMIRLYDDKYNNPLKFWYFLEATYGAAQHTQSTKRVQYGATMKCTMESHEEFTNYIQEYERLCNLCGVSEVGLLFMLLSDGTEIKSIKMLPDRLMGAVKYCQDHHLDYTASKLWIKGTDDDWHLKHPDAKPSKSVKAVDKKYSNQEHDTNSNEFCINCYNHGHVAAKCKLDACTGCQQFKCGHRKHTCPKYNKGTKNNGGNKQTNKSNNKPKQNYNKDKNDDNRRTGPPLKKRKTYDPDDESEEEEKPKKKSTTSTSNKKPYQKPRKKVEAVFSAGDSDEEDEEASGNNENDEEASSNSDNEDDVFDDSDVQDSSDNESIPEEVVNQVTSTYRMSEHEGKVEFKRKSRKIAQVKASVKSDNCENNIKVVKKSVKVNRINSGSFTKPKFLCDSGAQENLVPSSGKSLMTNVTEFARSKDAPVSLSGVGGEELNILASGDINQYIENAYEVSDIDHGILSLSKFREAGLWSIIPPSNISPDHGCFVFDSDGKTQLVSDKDLMADVTDMGNYNVSVTLPSLRELIDSLSKKSFAKYQPPPKYIRAVYGFKPKSVEELTHFCYDAYLFSQSDMVWAAESGAIDNFPITGEQAKKYYQDSYCKLAGSMQMRKTDHHQFDAHPETKKREPKEERHHGADRFNIGNVVGSDFYGPFMNVSAVTFVDKCSGWCKTTFVEHSKKKGSASTIYKNSKKDVTQCIRWADKMYKKFGHSIKTLKTDNDAVYTSHEVNECLDDLHITPDVAPSGNHALNGLAESYNKYIPGLVISMFCNAPHLPPTVWPRVWETAEITSSLRQSKKPGSQITRFEEFTGQRPNMKKLVMLPVGIPVVYYIYKEMRKGVFSKKARLGAYLGPCLNSAGSIWILNMDTKRVCMRSTYRVLKKSQVPTSWQKYDFQNFMSKPSNDNVDLLPLVADEAHFIDEDPEVFATEGVTIIEDATDPITASQPSEGVGVSNMHVSQQLEGEVIDATDAIHNISDTTANDNANVIQTTPSEGVATTTDVNDVVHTDTIDNTTTNNTDVTTNTPSILNTTGAGVTDNSVDNNINNDVQNATTTTTTSTATNLSDRSRRETAGTYKDGPARLRSVSNRKQRKHMEYKRKQRHLIKVLVSQRDAHIPDEVILKNIAAMNAKMGITKAGNVRVKIIRDVEATENNKVLERETKKIMKRVAKMKVRTADNPTLKQAQEREDWPKWEAAINEELNQLLDDEVFVEEYYNFKNLPKDANVVGSMFVLQRKRDKISGMIERYKARLVALGNQQKENSYSDIKSKTAQAAIVKLLVAIQAKTGAKANVLDVKGAFLKSPIREERGEFLYLRLPDGRIVKLRKYLIEIQPQLYHELTKSSKKGRTVN